MSAKKDRYRGRMIAFEGIDGTGKSTQIHLLKRWLDLQGVKVFLCEWEASELVKNTTSKVRNRELLTPNTFALLHATDFADRYDRQVLPLLRAGYIVLWDRFYYAAFARDVVRGCPPAWVRGLYGFAEHADLTFFFKAPLETCLSRIRTDRLDPKYFEAGMDLRLSTDSRESFRLFQERLFEQYLWMSTEYGFRVVDAAQPIEAQQQLVRRIVEDVVHPSEFTFKRP
ncbi:MAG: thymidylate kinase [Verrucomicrobiales bacterium]|nr:thymidylate kinase [Verrucomicrobiales bacterium]